MGEGRTALRSGAPFHSSSMLLEVARAGYVANPHAPDQDLHGASGGFHVKSVYSCDGDGLAARIEVSG
ncbi:hypothetical protein ADL26_02635 [Thermoactinomyces vulgaris]|nr:hypothetical protein ADL26_02635 [Thermoactinomyces vulgaris]